MKFKFCGKFCWNVCDFLFIKFNFFKDWLMECGYIVEYDKFKFVIYCMDDKFVFRENVVWEYLVYCFYNIIFDKSYWVQLVCIDYIDSKDWISRIRCYGFIFEDIDEMVYCVGGKECEECINVLVDEFV